MRRLKKEEKKYIDRINNLELYHFIAFLFIMFLVPIILSVFLIYEEGLIGTGGLASLMVTSTFYTGGFAIYYFVGIKVTNQISSDNKVVFLSEKIRKEISLFKSKFRLGNSKVEIPSHWENYISLNHKIDMKVCPGEYKNYALSVNGNMSVEKDIKKGYDELFSYRPKRNACVGIFFSFSILFFGILFVNLGITGGPSTPRPTTITGFFNNWFEYGPLVLMVGFGIPSVWYIYRHFKQLSEVREMYEEEMGLEPA